MDFTFNKNRYWAPFINGKFMYYFEQMVFFGITCMNIIVEAYVDSKMCKMSVTVLSERAFLPVKMDIIFLYQLP